MAVEAARPPLTLAASRNVSRKWPPSGCGASSRRAITCSADKSRATPDMGLTAVLALADLAEDLPLRFSNHAEALLDGRHVGAQEGIGLEFQVHARRQGRLAGRAQGVDLLGALLQGGVVGLDGKRELGVGLRVLVATIDHRLSRQGDQPF